MFRYEDQLLGFASQEFLNWFAAAPQDYMDAVLTEVLHHPACIALLDLESSFPDLSLDRLIDSVALEPDTLESECQTELHPVAKCIDRTYEWNEWEHRRKALAMVNLRQKRTHGAQTILSHFRRENATQVCHACGLHGGHDESLRQFCLLLLQVLPVILLVTFHWVNCLYTRVKNFICL